MKKKPNRSPLPDVKVRPMPPVASPAPPRIPMEPMTGPPRPIGFEVPVWRKNPPTEPGLYWYTLRTTEELGEGVLRFCRVWEHDGVLVSTAGAVCKPAAEFQRWWAGPLLEPIK